MKITNKHEPNYTLPYPASSLELNAHVMIPQHFQVAQKTLIVEFQDKPLKPESLQLSDVPPADSKKYKALECIPSVQPTHRHA